MRDVLASENELTVSPSRRYELLKRAETLSEGAPLEKALTYNNLACYYRRAGKLRTALTYLERALAIEEKVRLRSGQF